MGKASQAKKIKRVQQAGVTRSPGQRRNLAYPALIVAIVVVGVLFVFLARESRRSTAAVVPSTEDVWFDAFGIDVCGSYQDQLANVGDGTGPFVVLDNGLIRIAPSNDEEAGEGARRGCVPESRVEDKDKGGSEDGLEVAVELVGQAIEAGSRSPADRGKGHVEVLG
jgi:hypothetical protein